METTQKDAEAGEGGKAWQLQSWEGGRPDVSRTGPQQVSLKAEAKAAHAPSTDDRRSQHFSLYFIDFSPPQERILVTINRT